MVFSEEAERGWVEENSGEYQFAIIERESGEMFWGAGTDTDIIKASTNALLNAFHNMTKGGK